MQLTPDELSMLETWCRETLSRLGLQPQDELSLHHFSGDTGAHLRFTLEGKDWTILLKPDDMRDILESSAEGRQRVFDRLEDTLGKRPQWKPIPPPFTM